jgi:uncharacterized protein YkwD
MSSVTSLASSKQLSREVWRFQNEVRQNPSVLIPLIQQDLRYFQGNTIYAPGQPGLNTDEGPSAWNEAIEFLKSQRPLHPLDWSDALEAAAIDHAYDSGPKGRTGHVGSDGSSSADRVIRHGQWQSVMGENISYGRPIATNIVMQLIVDDGVPSRGHRHNIFKPDFNVVGVGAAPHTVYGCVCVLDYAGGMAPGSTAGYSPSVPSAVFDIAKQKEAEHSQARAVAQKLPLGCVSQSVETSIRVSGGRKTVTTTTVSRFADGREEKRVETAETVEVAGN